MTRKILMDSHAVIWSVAEPDRLGSELREFLNDSSFVPLVSTVSLWEILSKARSGKLQFAGDPEFILKQHLANLRALMLPLRPEHVYAAYRLPVLHKDPWDRLLIGQAIAEGAALATKDTVMQRYEVPIVW